MQIPSHNVTIKLNGESTKFRVLGEGPDVEFPDTGDGTIVPPDQVPINTNHTHRIEAIEGYTGKDF